MSLFCEEGSMAVEVARTAGWSVRRTPPFDPYIRSRVKRDAPGRASAGGASKRTMEASSSLGRVLATAPRTRGQRGAAGGLQRAFGRSFVCLFQPNVIRDSEGMYAPPRAPPRALPSSVSTFVCCSRFYSSK
eukprot:6583247-Prymnesium_polylepis.2